MEASAPAADFRRQARRECATVRAGRHPSGGGMRFRAVDRSICIVFGVVLFSAVAPPHAGAATRPTPAQKCSAAKRTAAGKELACKLACTAKAMIKGLRSDDP